MRNGMYKHSGDGPEGSAICCCTSRNESVPPLRGDPAAATGVGARENPVFVKGGKSFIGTNSPAMRQDGEGPAREININDYWLEAETVTVSRFAAFVSATNYATEAERFGWSAVFRSDEKSLAAGETSSWGLPWWHRVDGANWRQPEGPGSSVADRFEHPVTQVSWADANAFAAWVGGRLASEAEWEHAARGGAVARRFPWGEEEPTDEKIFANIWQGTFPEYNALADGYGRTAPARSFAPNPLGFYNMAGNVWEWTHDAFRIHSNSKPARLRNAQALEHAEKVLKGGSFLCHISYCYRYRIAARMALTPDSATSNVGFRIAYYA